MRVKDGTASYSVVTENASIISIRTGRDNVSVSALIYMTIKHLREAGSEFARYLSWCWAIQKGPCLQYKTKSEKEKKSEEQKQQKSTEVRTQESCRVRRITHQSALHGFQTTRSPRPGICC